jgi:pyruvate dehydrogenase E1 component alpha subunit
MKGHGVYDKGEYRPREEVEKWLAKDPIKTFEKRLIDEKIMNENKIQEIGKSVQQEIEDSVKFATEGAALPFEDILNYVYAGDD